MTTWQLEPVKEHVRSLIGEFKELYDRDALLSSQSAAAARIAEPSIGPVAVSAPAEPTESSGGMMGPGLTETLYPCIGSTSALSRHRRRHVHCTGMSVPVLKTTAFLRRSF